MTKAQFYKFHKEMTAKMHAITLAKNSDYTSGVGDTDPFANFRQVEKFGICSAELGFLTRMSDKFARIASYAKAGKLLVKDESVQDTCLDLANYMILFLGFLEEKKQIIAQTKTVKRQRPSRAKTAEVNHTYRETPVVLAQESEATN